MLLAEQQLEQRLELGDKLEVSRPIEHSAYFTRRSEATTAGAELEALGYATLVSRRGFKHLLAAQRTETLDEASVRGFLSELLSSVSAHGGEYDGWGGEVAESD